MGPPKTCQVISTLLSAGIGTGDGGDFSARERHKAQRQRTFQFWILVIRLSLISWSLAGWESLMRSMGGEHEGEWVKREEKRGKGEGGRGLRAR